LVSYLLRVEDSGHSWNFPDIGALNTAGHRSPAVEESIVKLQLAFFSAAVLVCVGAAAQNQPSPSTEPAPSAAPSMLSIFDSLDTNQDGRISQDEAQASPVVSRSFSKADANGDGAISRDEFTSSFTTRAPDTAPPPAPEPPR
jgi:hypothetical protein